MKFRVNKNIHPLRRPQHIRYLHPEVSATAFAAVLDLPSVQRCLESWAPLPFVGPTLEPLVRALSTTGAK